KLTAAHAARSGGAQAKAQEKYEGLCPKAATLNPQAQFGRAEGAVPHCVPADARGPAQDLLRYPSRAILYQGADKKHEWLHTGEMILVGQAWRLTDAPSVSDVDPVDPAGGGGDLVASNDPALKKRGDAP